MVVFTKVKEEDLTKLKKLRFAPAAPRTAYEVIRYEKNGVHAVYYTSGKLFLQGKKEKVDRIADELRKVGIGDEVKKISFRRQSGWMVGSDESLKGDSFGGIVVAAVRADDEIRGKLKDLGVADSKALRDTEVLRLAQEVRDVAECAVYSLLPEEYNREAKVTLLLNKMHKKVANQVGAGRHIVDEYPGCTVGEIVETKAEQKYIEVAAASILARAAGLKQFDYLSMEAGFKIPKGSTHVKLALHELKERGLEFRKFAKLNFKNVQEFL